MCILCLEVNVVTPALVQGNYGKGAVQDTVFGKYRTLPNADWANRSAIEILGPFNHFHSEHPSLNVVIAKLFQCVTGNL